MEVLIILLIFWCAYLTVRIYNNKRYIELAKERIETNEVLIQQNYELIRIVSIMLSNSDIKVDWERHAKAVKTILGVDINDPERNLDITDPEG